MTCRCGICVLINEGRRKKSELEYLSSSEENISIREEKKNISISEESIVSDKNGSVSDLDVKPENILIKEEKENISISEESIFSEKNSSVSDLEVKPKRKVQCEVALDAQSTETFKSDEHSKLKLGVKRRRNIF